MKGHGQIMAMPLEGKEGPLRARGGNFTTTGQLTSSVTVTEMLEGYAPVTNVIVFIL